MIWSHEVSGTRLQYYGDGFLLTRVAFKAIKFRF